MRVPINAIIGIGGKKLESFILLFAVHLVDDALMGVDQRRQLGQQQPAHGGEIALALQHVGELGEVRLQPILLGIAIGGEPQIVDHRVDIVFELSHFAARIDLNRSRQVAFGHGRRHFGDGAHLGRQICGEQIDVAGQVLPGAGSAWHVGLPAETAFDADFARHRGHLIGERGERVRHIVDGFGERRDLAFRFHRQALLEVAVGDRGHHLDDAAYLFGEVRRHDVDGVSQILPGAGDAGHLRLTAEQAFGADFARHARHFRGKTVELVHHRVDGVF